MRHRGHEGTRGLSLSVVERRAGRLRAGPEGGCALPRRRPCLLQPRRRLRHRRATRAASPPAACRTRPPPRLSSMTGIDPSLISDCIHCGFCLPTCPTYGPLRQEEMAVTDCYLVEGWSSLAKRLRAELDPHGVLV